ncbi:MAG: V-type ATP synthase subunit D [Chlamydiales bacterium]|nr:V-type ATP synthase subunit D [Chlamydiales bacterium]MCH9635318.1 V-type ATP synthase subunit D [Chlamydiales bacterium]
MSEIKLTKNELRSQQGKLNQLQRYLPTLQLKKAMLQTEVNEVRLEIEKLEESFHVRRRDVSTSAGLFNAQIGIDIEQAAKVDHITKKYENIAGVDIPLFEDVVFEPFEYALFGTPAWLDLAVEQLRDLAKAKARVLVATEKKEALEQELREVSIRVNLFEKNLIPKAETNIKRIRIFLGDQELAAVGQAKVAKAKIIMRKKEREDAR